MNKRAIIATAALAVGALGITGCSTTADADSNTGASTAASEAPLFDSLPAAVQDAGVIRIAADAHPPYRTIQPGGGVTGIDADFWKLVSAQLGVEVKFEEAATMPAILTGIESDRYDAYNGPLGASPEREEKFDMVGWMKNDVSYLYKSDSKFSDIEDMCGLSIGHGVGSIVEQAVAKLSAWCEEEGLPASTPVALKDTSTTMVALQSGQIQAAGMTEAAALDIVNANEGDYDYTIQTSEQGVETVISSVLVKRGSGLAEPIYEALKNIFADGDYEALMAEWKLEPIAIPEPLLNPTTNRAAE